MAAPSKTKAIMEFGDFQTPFNLALAVTRLLRDLGVRPSAILEPTCGRGAFLTAAAMTFPEAQLFMGFEINPVYAQQAMERLVEINSAGDRLVHTGNFFEVDWKNVISSNAGPWLILGNPPWVTSSSLGAIGSQNIPAKSNIRGHSGIEAVTGKSNFDISEWMLLQYLDWLKGLGSIAVLCKTSVARKVLSQLWKREIGCITSIYKIDALEEFGAAVDACLFVAQLLPHAGSRKCLIFDSPAERVPSGSLGMWNGYLISDMDDVGHLEALWGPEAEYSWRSGVKHDCSRVMELSRTPQGYENGLGEIVDIEEEFLFPILKGSDIGNERTEPRGAMIVTQKAVGEETSMLEVAAPRTWNYLLRHQGLLSKRGSIVYRNNPRFSVFGVGPYTFASWKLAICGLYKNLRFVPVGPVGGKPTVFDDTVSFLACNSEAEARFLADLMHSDEAQEFLNSMIYWADKRPITVDILKRLSLRKLARVLEREKEFDCFSASNSNAKEPARLLFAS